MKRGRKPMPTAERRARELFVRAVLAKGTCVLRRADDPCGGPCDPHHIIPKQRLKAHSSTLSRQERMELVWDPRNGVPVCRHHHHQLSVGFRRLHHLKLPPEAVEFASDHGLAWAL